MKAAIFQILALLGVVAMPAVAPAQAERPTLVAQGVASSVMIEAIGAGGRLVNGAGFIWNDKDEIATAAHVVKGAGAIVLRLPDGRVTRGRVVAADESFDLAIVAADQPTRAAPLAFASESPDLGEPVIAIGNPFGHAFSVSAGIVSGLDRTFDPSTPHGFLQHDAAINPGSSGGPLLGRSGHVIGVNAAIPNGRRTDVGVGFAIPAAVARRVLAELSSSGRITHGRLGARLRAIDPTLALALGRNDGGALVEEVEPGSPAARAGLEPGDFLLAIDGRAIIDLRRVAEAVTGGRPGAQIRFDAIRGDKPVIHQVVLGEAPRVESIAALAPVADMKRALGIEFSASGRPVIKSIAPRSPADIAGLRARDLVLAIGTRRVHDAAQARVALNEVTAADIALLARREGVGARYLVLSRGPITLARSPFQGNREADGSSLF